MSIPKVLAIGGIVIGIVVGGFVLNKVMYVGQQSGRVFEKTFDADNMIYNYEWFKRQYADVKAWDLQIVALEQSMAAMETQSVETRTFEDKQAINSLRTQLNGLRGQRQQMVAEYNAKSQMANRSIFRTGDLPESLN